MAEIRQLYVHGCIDTNFITSKCKSRSRYIDTNSSDSKSICWRMFTKHWRPQGKPEHSHRRKTTPKAGKGQQEREFVSGSKQSIRTKEKGEEEKREYMQQGKQSPAERARREEGRREIRKHVRVHECQCEESQEAILWTLRNFVSSILRCSWEIEARRFDSRNS